MFNATPLVLNKYVYSQTKQFKCSSKTSKLVNVSKHIAVGDNRLALNIVLSSLLWTSIIYKRMTMTSLVNEICVKYRYMTGIFGKKWRTSFQTSITVHS